MKKKTIFKVFFSVMTVFLALTCIYSSLRSEKIKAQSNQIPIEQINIGYDNFLMPVINNSGTWSDTFTLYETSNFYYIYINSGLLNSSDFVGSFLINISCEYASENQMLYTNNQNNSCIGEFTIYTGPISYELDYYEFKYYIPSSSSIGYGSDDWNLFFTGFNTGHNNYNGEKYILRFNKSYIQYIDYYYYPQIIPLSYDLNYMLSYEYDFGYANGYDDGSDDGHEEGFEEGYAEALRDNDNNISSYSNLMRIVFDGASNFLNTKILGELTILHIILLPLTLGILMVIIKLIRG